MGQTKIAASILAADFLHLEDEINSVSTADYIHFDVMDGIFVPNVSFGFAVLDAIRPVTSLVLDVHLMIVKPLHFALEFARRGADIVVCHIEADAPEEILSAIRAVKFAGKKTGLAIKPDTPIERVMPFLEELDMVLVMTVEPGFGGQKFKYRTLNKVAALRGEIERLGLDCDVEVDGGINRETAKLAVEAGANVLVSGSEIFGKKNRIDAIKALRN